MVPFDKGTNHFLVEDGFASQSLDARSERQVVTLDTLSEYLPGQMHLARHLSGVTPPSNPLRLIAIMVNSRFHMTKRGSRRHQNACIAFLGVSTPKTGHFTPESLQRFLARFRGLFGPIWFRPVFASCGPFR